MGGFSVSGLKYGEDWAFLLAVYTHGFKLNLVETHTTFHREHQGAMTDRFNWHPYRASHLQPYMEDQLQTEKITKADLAIFQIGGCYNAPYREVPGIIFGALKLDPLLILKNPAFLMYGLWNLGRRISSRH